MCSRLCAKCYYLVVIVNRPAMTLAFSGHVASTRIRKALAAQGVKMSHGHVLMLLAEAGAMGQGALIEALGVDPSVVVTILNDLENDGLAERRRDPADRRRHIVEISERGVKLVTDVHSAIASVEAELFADLDDSEVATLQRLLARITASGNECGGED